MRGDAHCNAYSCASAPSAFNPCRSASNSSTIAAKPSLDRGECRQPRRGGENFHRSHFRSCDDRRSLRHRFEKHETLRLGQRGEYKDIRCAIAIL